MTWKDMTLEDALKAWDAGDIVTSIEMGGLGAGYEQAIQIGTFELAKEIKDVVLPEDSDKLNTMLDQFLRVVMDKDDTGFLDGLSGAQAGAIKSLAYHFVVDGYVETLSQVEDDRRTMTQNNMSMKGAK